MDAKRRMKWISSLEAPSVQSLTITRLPSNERNGVKRAIWPPFHPIAVRFRIDLFVDYHERSIDLRDNHRL